MANEIQVTAAEVRALINPQMSAAQLPDPVIELNAYKGAAIAEVQGRAPDFAGLEDDSAEAKALNRAADAITAARLIIAFPNLTGKAAGDVKIQQEAYDVEARVAWLRQFAEAEFAFALGDGTATEDMPTIFATAPGYRGR